MHRPTVGRYIGRPSADYRSTVGRYVGRLSADMSTETTYSTHDPNGLPKYLSEELENIQRRALRIIFPVLGYQEALKECNFATFYQRRLFSEIKDNICHKLHGLLPLCNLSTVALRRKRAFNVPFCRPNRLKNSFIM